MIERERFLENLNTDVVSGVVLQVVTTVTPCFGCHGKKMHSEAGSDARTTHQSQCQIP